MFDSKCKKGLVCCFLNFRVIEIRILRNILRVRGRLMGNVVFIEVVLTLASSLPSGDFLSV